MIGLEQLKRLWSSLVGLGARRLAALGIVGITVFAAVGFSSYYLSRPELDLLYSGLSAQDVSRIGTVLREAGIHFDVNSEGTKVMVRPGQTARARMLLAEKGLPSSANAGYELFDKIGSIGLTSFMQEITRVRALEGEIARTIQAMRGVRAARVHIVFPTTGSFRRTVQPPSASVVIRTDRPEDFSGAQAIRHLVSAAVPGMNIEQVRVITTDGTVLAAGDESSHATSGKMVELEKTVAKELQQNVRKTLAPYLGIDNFELSVTAKLNLDKRQINETSYSPEGRAERSVRTVKETGSSQNASSRASVGVEQNVPAEQATTAPSGDQSKKSNERKEELRNYELSSRTVSTVSDGYKIENITVAAVINRKQLVASLGGKPAQEAIDAHLKELQGLIESAAGINVGRGDRVTVSAVDFLQSGQLEPAPGPGMVEQLLQQTGAIMKGLSILGATILLIWFGLKPALRALLDAPRTTGAPALPAVSGPAAGSAAATASGGERPRRVAEAEDAPNLIADLTSKMERTPQKRLEQMIDYDQEQAAAILKQWMQGVKPA